MTDLSPTAIAASLAELSRDLDAVQRMLADADYQATVARHEHEQAFAKATICATGSNAESRRAEATLETDRLALDADVKAVLVRSLKSRMDVLRTRIDVGRSIGASLRSEVHA